MTPETPYALHRGAWLEISPMLADCSVDAIVIDPPYHLTAGKKGGTGEASVNPHSPAGRSMIGTGFMGMAWDGGAMAFDVATWREALRVLKPGGHLLAFSGTRTYHRMVCAIEDAGFEIRDQLGWVYGSGFPKSLDVSKAIDKAAGAAREVLAEGKAVKRMIPGADQNATGSWIKDNGRAYVPQVTAPATDAAAEWEGWGTALKPAWEPICMARKPLVGTVAANVLAWRTGALNIDACRVDLDGDYKSKANGRPSQTGLRDNYDPSKANKPDTVGRWPANIVHDGSPEVLDAFPAAPGQLATSSSSSARRTQNVYGAMEQGSGGIEPRGDAGSAARFFYCAKASRADRHDGLPDPGPQLQHGSTLRDAENAAAERAGNFHPTVKPTELMRWLTRLVTPPGGLVLDFCVGSGSTGKACMYEGFRFIGVDLDSDAAGAPLGYLDIAEARIAHAWRQVQEDRKRDAANRATFVQLDLLDAIPSPTTTEAA